MAHSQWEPAWNQGLGSLEPARCTQTSLTPKNEKGNLSPVSRFPSAQNQEQTNYVFLHYSQVRLLLWSIVRNLSETELNPNVPTNSGAGSKVRGQG